MTSSWGVRILGLVVIVIVVTAVVVAIFILGPPKRQRQRNLDERRVQDLMQIEGWVNSYWQRHKELPPDIVTLSREPGFGPPVMDPENGSPYRYEIKDADSFRLCAEFAFDSAEEPSTWTRFSPGSWAHGAGRHCFDLSIPRSAQDENRK